MKISRYDPIPETVTCMIRVKRNNIWYDQRPLVADGCFVTVEYCKRVVERLRRKGREVKVVWLTGMGLGIDNA